ncbi:MAG TPA: hypothetical protein VF746_15020 [Longimicrobium sp.]|jgi:hypothetical protein
MPPAFFSIAEVQAAAPAAWYNQPVVNTVLTLVLGGVILNWLKERWARQEKKRDKALEFLENTGDRLNHLLSLVFGTLRTGDLSAERLEELRSRRRPIFEKRFAVRLGAESYLGNPSFWRKYDILANQIYELVEVLAVVAQRRGDLSVLEDIRRQEAMLTAKWPAEGTQPDAADGQPAVAPGDQVLSEMLRWTTMIWRRSIQLISVPLHDMLATSSHGFQVPRRLRRPAP